MAASESSSWLDDHQSTAWRRFIAVVELLPGILDSQLRRDADLILFEYFTLAMLSEASDRMLRTSRYRWRRTRRFRGCPTSHPASRSADWWNAR